MRQEIEIQAGVLMWVSVKRRASFLVLPSSPRALEQLSLPRRLSALALQKSRTPLLP